MLALAVMWRLGTLLFGDAAGIAATALLALNPIFWLAGVANFVRVYLALGAVTVALLVWRCWTAEPGRERLFFRAPAAALVDLSGGIRKNAIVLPPGNVAWLDPVPAAYQHALDALEPAQENGPFHVARVKEGRGFSVDDQPFAVTSGP